MDNINNLALFLFELGTLRTIARSHRQALFTNDLSDNISSHTYRVTTIGMFLALIEKADVGKVMLMCHIHDWPETRSGDANWIHKRYVAIDTPSISYDQAQMYQFEEIQNAVQEYEKRETTEALIAKDADLLDQVCLLKEYELQGNKEASLWLTGRENKPYARLEKLHFESSKTLGRAIYDSKVSSWWKDMYTSENKQFKKG